MSRYTAVIDTSVLITLEAVGLLEHLDQLFHSVHVPAAVRAEFLGDEEHRLGTSDAALTTILERPPFTPCDTYDFTNLELLKEALGDGEAEVIEQSQKVRAGIVLIDERRGRRVAEQRMLVVRGAARIVAQLHVAGFCGDYAMAINRARQVGVRISPAVEAQALLAARRGEW